mmetsp:Transcript_55385/g.132674  ORF Transcript_55385/g.132674 Transcript_55385/m.132674 type:complete len:95 (-) Transcript_55385:590-874(-)
MCPAGHRLRRRNGEAAGLCCDGGCGSFDAAWAGGAAIATRATYDSCEGCCNRGQAAARGGDASSGGGAGGGGVGGGGTGDSVTGRWTRWSCGGW